MNLAKFESYKEINSQYEDDFIRNSLAVKISEDNYKVEIVIAVSKVEETLLRLKDFHFPKKVEYTTVADSEFAEFIGKILDCNKNDSNITDKVGTEYKLDEVSDSSQVINIINSICIEAIRKNASDIHIQCCQEYVNVRFRIDGVIQTVRRLSKDYSAQISSRIKIMAGLNIMETRLPQDGHISVSIDDEKIDFRVSFVPVTSGESIVLRIFDNNKKSLSLEDLGFNERTYDILNKAIEIPNGVILVTGPTGSGKTTTLHSMIKNMDIQSLKIITIEDPVEKQIEGIDQIQVNDSIGLSFGNILRRVLRQDPDVIMVGEIRDVETAELVVRAALTGHVILSTLHTNDSISIVTRLRNMGIEPYLISSVFRYGIAQRLVRKLCPFCSKEVELNLEMKELKNKYSLHGETMKISKGCSKCGFTGYKGRTAISEVYGVSPKLGLAIEEKQPNNILESIVEEEGFISLRKDAVTSVLDFKTSYSEIKREGLI